MQTALITGGGSGIGASIARSLVADGMKVAITGRRKAKLDEIAAADSSGRIITHACDVADRKQVAELFDWANDQLGKIDILVNAAGLNLKHRSLSELEPEEWDLLLNINATGAFNCTRLVLPQMRERKDGLIINISSVAGKRAAPLGGVGYNASKFAMSALGISVAEEERENNIRVTNIYPGEVDTPILEERPRPVTPEHRARILQPEDVAAAVAMVARLPARAHVPELVIVPTSQSYV